GAGNETQPGVFHPRDAAGGHRGELDRSEERPVGEEGRSRGAPHHLKKKKTTQTAADLNTARYWSCRRAVASPGHYRAGMSPRSVWCSVPGQAIRCADFFFFSSRRRHTRLVSDWSSDVCSSD